MINLPTYSKGEEIFNCISHAVGTILSIVVIIYCFISKISGIKLVSCLIYATSLLILYSASALYHGLSKKYEKTKKVLRIIDHCVIYLLIGGSYTPFILIIIRDYNFTLGNFLYNLYLGNCSFGNLS
jgi:Predicted membrane protein, hemolysin III homolog